SKAMDDLRARFIPMFIKGALERVARGKEHIAEDDATAAFAELHALAGEAAILGIDHIARSARQGELAAKRWRETDAADGREECARQLHVVGEAVARLGTEPP